MSEKDPTMKRKILFCLASAADLLMPRHCAVCGGKLLTDEKHLCIWCSYGLPLTYFWLESRNPMADRLNAIIQDNIVNSTAPREPYSFAMALYHFSSPDTYGNISKSLKYHGNLSIGRKFAGMLAEKIRKCAYMGPVDAVVPVPLHRSRLRQRGYNQSEVIAAEIAVSLGCRLERKMLRRVKKTESQTRLASKDRKENVSGAFSVAGSIAERYAVQHVHILLVDDVFTTGATLGECHKVLRRWFRSRGIPADELRISVASLAFAG